MSNRVYIVNGRGDYVAMFQAYGFQVVKDLVDANLVCFTGGSDVSPYLYGDIQHRLTQNNVQRDEYEKEKFKEAVAEGIPMVGICRGGQFLNVMNGGRMYQHVTNHAIGGLHWLTTNKGEQIRVTSTHHQMFMPRMEDNATGTGAIIIATANENGYREWMENGELTTDRSDEDYEVVYYPSTKSLCFQPHPEFMPKSRMTQWFFELIKEYCNEQSPIHVNNSSYR